MLSDNFSPAFKEHFANLHKYFYVCLTSVGFRGDKKEAVRILIQLTGYRAFEYSLSENGGNYEIAILIWLKAKNLAIDVWSHDRIIWAEISPGQAQDNSDYLDQEYSGSNRVPRTLDQIIDREQIERIRPYVSKRMWVVLKLLAEGHSYPQIAAIHREKAAAIRMNVHRLRKRLKKLLDEGII
jgi:hypothetical protein